MARPIWTGTLSFGLLNVPVSLMTGEKNIDLHFRMLDVRDKAQIRYERVNADTGEEVPWKDIVKAFEYDKGSYVVLEPEDIKSAAPQSHETVEVEAFVDADSIGPQYFEKPYILVPGKKAEKGYVLLRETLRTSKKIGIARVVIRTREYLCAVMPQGKALILILLRYPQELVDIEEHKIPDKKLSDYRISAQELKMASQLIASMSGEWKPGDFRDEFRERLSKVVQKRIKTAGAVTKHKVTEKGEMPEGAATNVVDFMSLLQKSLASSKRTPAQKTVEKVVAKKPARKSAAKKEAVKPAATKKTKKSA